MAPRPEDLPFEEQWHADQVHVWRVPLECSPSEVERLRSLLGADELDRAGRFHFQRDRDRFTAGRAHLRLLLAGYLRCSPAAVRFRYGQAGKPELAVPGPPFNVSHSDGLAVIAIGGPGRLGVDIERIRPIPADRAFAGFFALAEQTALQAMAPTRREQAFFDCWTRKEAYLKGRGDGLSFGLDRFEVSVGPGSPPELLHVEGDPAEVSRWELRSLHLNSGYTGALAVEGHDWRLLCRDWIAGLERTGG